MTIDTQKLRRLSKALTPGPTPSHYGIIGRAADRLDAQAVEIERLREALTELVETAKLYGLREDDYIIYQARAALSGEGR